MRFSENNKDKYDEVKENITMNNLEKIMERNNLSDTKLGSELYLSDSSIQGYRYNTKYPSLVSLVKLADYFNVNIDYLLDRTTIETRVDELINYNSNVYNELIVLYNKLSQTDKAKVTAYINGLLDAEKKN